MPPGDLQHLNLWARAWELYFSKFHQTILTPVKSDRGWSRRAQGSLVCTPAHCLHALASK